MKGGKINMKKLTKRKLKQMIRDEKEGYEEYSKYGLKKLARDEYKHKMYLKKLLKKLK